MNCQELTQLLDDGDLRNVPHTMRRELDAHLSGCADCAAEWRAQERIIMTIAPRATAGFIAQCRQLAAAGAARLFVPRRVILYSTLLVLAAAAALLAWRMGSPTSSNETVAVVPVIAQPAPVIARPVEVPPRVRPEPKLEPQAAAPPAATFTVAVRPLQIEGDDPEGNAMAARFRDRVMALLHGVPNLVLVDMQSSTGTAPAEYELRMIFTGSSTVRMPRRVALEIRKSSEFVAIDAAVAAEATMSPADQQRSKLTRQVADIMNRRTSMRDGNTGVSRLLGEPSPTLAIIGDPMLGDRVDFAAQQLVGQLRVKAFPRDQAFEQAQLALLSSPAQTYALRRLALAALLAMAERHGGFAQTSPAVVRAGAQFALDTQGQVSLERPVIWDALALTGSPELVPYLIRGLTEVPQTETRLQLVKILGGKYGDDPRARAALAATAKSNDQQTVRMAALRESGDSKWSEYVVTALLDSTLPDVQRLQPIAEMAPGETATLGTSPKTKMVLEEQQLRELGKIIIRIAPDSTASETIRKALFAAGAMETPAALDMLIEILHSIHTDDVPPGMPRVSILGVRQTARSLVGFRYAGDPKARAIMAELANSSDGMESRDAQMQLRNMDMKASMEKARREQQAAQPPVQ